MSEFSIVPQLIANSVIAAGFYALVAMGFNLIYGTTKFFNLTHGVVAVVGGYTVFALTKMFGMPVWLAVIAGIVVAGLLGLLLNAVIFAPLRKRKATPMVFLVASLGAMTVVQAIVAMTFTSQFQTLSTGISDTKIFNIFGGIITDIQLIVIVSAFVIMLVLGWVLRKTMFGKTVEAISDSEEVSRVVGINTEKVIAKVFLGALV